MSLLVACTPSARLPSSEPRRDEPPTKRRRQDPQGSNALLLLGSKGLDIIQNEIFPLVAARYECRRSEDVAAFYSEENHRVPECYHPCRFSPPALAAFNGDVSGLRLLRERGLQFAPIMAAHNGHSECLEALRGWGCDLQATSHGFTPAHKAAENGHEDCLRLLKEAGCDLGQANSV